MNSTSQNDALQRALAIMCEHFGNFAIVVPTQDGGVCVGYSGHQVFVSGMIAYVYENGPDDKWISVEGDSHSE
jgi:hypothetical protein